MPINADALEKQLLDLGRRELELEKQLQALLEKSRSSGRAGQHAQAEATWSAYEDARRQFLALQKEITTAETRLYHARRARRQ